MIGLSIDPVRKQIDRLAARWFDRGAGADLAPARVIELLQPTGWGTLAYAATAFLIAFTVNWASEHPIGTLHYGLTLLALLLAPVALVYPGLGMMLVIGAVLIMPPGTRIPGIPVVSPNVLFAVMTLTGFVIRLALRWQSDRRVIAWTDLYVPLLPMLGLHAAFALAGYGPRALFFFQSFVQGGYPLVVTRTSQRTPRTLLTGLTVLITAWTGRSLYLLLFYGFPSCWNGFPHNSGGLGPMRYGHTLYGDPATVLAWIANLMVGLTFGLFVFARAWPSRLYFFFTFVVSLLVAWLSLARGGMAGSTIALIVVAVIAWQARHRLATGLGVLTAIGVICFAGSCLPIIPHVAESVGIKVDQTAQAPSLPDPRFGVWCQGVNRFGGFCQADEDELEGEDLGGLPNLLIGDGPGTRRGYHSYVINSAVDYGLPFLGLVLLMGYLVLRNGIRLVEATRNGEPLVRGAAVGLLAGSIVAMIQAVFDSTLRVVGYATIFWYLQGTAASLLAAVDTPARAWLARIPRLVPVWRARDAIQATYVTVLTVITLWVVAINAAFYVAAIREFGPELVEALTGTRVRVR